MSTQRMFSSYAIGIRIVFLSLFSAAVLITVISHHYAKPQTQHGQRDSAAGLNKNPTRRNEIIAELIPFTNSTLINQAAESVRKYVNNYRAQKCPDQVQFSRLDRIMYTQGSYGVNGSHRYAMELVLDNASAFFAVVEHNTSSTKSQVTNETFAVISNIPGPCDEAILDQLAVSVTGPTCSFFLIILSTPWT